MPLEIRLLEESEYRAVNDFYNKTLPLNNIAPPKPRTYDEFSWEFINRPNGKAIYAGAWEYEEGKAPALVGIQCFLILKMITGNGRQILSAKGEATLIDARALIKYKGTDILKELVNILTRECQNKGVEFIWGFNLIPASYKRIGFESPFKSNHGIQILNPLMAYKNITSLKADKTVKENLRVALLTGLTYIFSLKKLFILSRKNRYKFNCGLNENKNLFLNACASDKLIFLLQDFH